MSPGTLAGYRELEHTADWELEAWAPDLAGLLEQAARGMYALAGARLAPQPRAVRQLNLQAPDAESLLVRFLSELLYHGEQEGLGFDEYEVHLQALDDGFRLEARLTGGPVESIDKEIKAVTYHNLKVRQTENGSQVRIVFDV